MPDILDAISDIELFRSATSLARLRSNWRALADQGGSAAFTRRQCLNRASCVEANIVNLAVRAEKRARRALALGALA